MIPDLAVLLGGIVIGVARQLRNGRLEFTYEQAWRTSEGAYPLSLSLPLATPSHADPVVRSYLSGLLPDNDKILTAWGHRFGVSPRNPFALLSYMGEDCPGAVQFVPVDRVAQLQSKRAPQIEWLTEEDVGMRLEALTRDHPTGRQPNDPGQFSLPGQPKIALLYDTAKGWGIPSGRTPTTHLLKPPTGQYEGFAENEYLCSEIMRAIGLPAAHSVVQDFAGQRAIVVERYDRIPSPRGPLRVHQEDMCQALGISSATKYENEGGPGITSIVSLLRTHSTNPESDVGTFLDAIALNWIIGGSDAHAKNYSVLLSHGQVRLAPFYDVISVLPYPALYTRKLKLAMRIGGEYRVDMITWRRWIKLAEQVGINEAEMINRVKDLSESVADTIETVCKNAQKTGLRHPIIKKMEEAVRKRATECVTAMVGYTR